MFIWICLYQCWHCCNITYCKYLYNYFICSCALKNKVIYHSFWLSSITGQEKGKYTLNSQYKLVIQTVYVTHAIVSYRTSQRKVSLLFISFITSQNSYLKPVWRLRLSTTFRISLLQQFHTNSAACMGKGIRKPGGKHLSSAFSVPHADCQVTADSLLYIQHLIILQETHSKN